jgi:TM2 domain-containing membrane protein YozV
MEEDLKNKSKKLEVVLWSIALPGFGQLLNRKYVKAILLIILEFLINVFGNFNRIIILSYHFEIEEAIAETNYLWLMFYSCLYFFAIWDAYKDAGGGKKPFAFLPLVFSAYVVTLGTIYSPSFTIFGYLIGPMWLPILSLPIGLLLGGLIQWILLKIYDKHGTTKPP